jgi:hypothetical protein
MTGDGPVRRGILVTSTNTAHFEYGHSTSNVPNHAFLAATES